MRSVEARIVKPAKFAHFVLRVSDLEEAISWYAAVLGMHSVHRNEFICFMTYDDEHHRLALVQSPTPTQPDALPSRNAPGLDHVAYTLNSLEDLLSTYKRLRDAGILPVWPINHGLTTSLYYADPDGHRVEFQVENLDSREALQGYMQSAEFAANPIGVEFDPEILLARYEQGDPLQDLLRQGAI